MFDQLHYIDLFAKSQSQLLKKQRKIVFGQRPGPSQYELNDEIKQALGISVVALKK